MAYLYPSSPLRRAGKGAEKVNSTSREKYALLKERSEDCGHSPHERGSYAAVKDLWDNRGRTDTGSGVR